MNEAVFFAWYLATKWLRNLWKFVSEVFTKPKLLLKYSFILTLLAFFKEDVVEFLHSLQPAFYTEARVLLAITAIIYVWKYSSPQNGVPWKEEYQNKYGWKKKLQ